MNNTYLILLVLLIIFMVYMIFSFPQAQTIHIKNTDTGRNAEEASPKGCCLVVQTTDDSEHRNIFGFWTDENTCYTKYVKWADRLPGGDTMVVWNDNSKISEEKCAFSNVYLK